MLHILNHLFLGGIYLEQILLVLARVRSKKKSPQRARLQSSTFGGFLDLVKISAIRSEVGPKSDPVRSRSEVGPKSNPVRSRSEVRSDFGRSCHFWLF